MTPIPEPRADIAAQIAAMLDRDHPKVAVFLPPGNEADAPDLPAHIEKVARPEGVLLTSDLERAAMFRAAADDVTMARILGYPEDKSAVVAACGGNPLLAYAVQARDFFGNVVTEAFTSPSRLAETRKAMAAHAPEGGSVAVLTSVQSIIRRIYTTRFELGI